MSKTLIVVESPAKAKTIEKFLGRNYTVKASMGHLRDLPKSQFGIDLEHDFAPKYINIRGKGDIIKGLKAAAKAVDKVYLASDPDREGEAIAWHLSHILNIPKDDCCRIEFNEITKTAVQSAIKSPRSINVDRVDAQQARRLLDRIVGYQLSPLLWRKVKKGLSAGRVQSVAVRMIYDREQEVQSFVSEEYWTIAVKLREKAKTPLFEAQLVSCCGSKPAIGNEEQASEIQAQLEQSQFVVREVKRRERRRNPAAPFTTSSLQQEAARKLGFTTRRTMMVAQQLYEGLDIGSSGHVGLITYMRTDSTRVAESAQQDARGFITAQYGKEYLPVKPPVYAAKKSAQDAHEAIRPTSLELPPDKVAQFLSKEQLKIYTLIWERFVASQMSAAVYDTVSVDIQAGDFGLRANGSQIKFAGFMVLYTESRDDKNEEEIANNVNLPDLQTEQQVELSQINPKQHFTEPPPRFTEASLVKMLEEKGIGRPSTYAPIIDTILARGYVTRLEKKFQPTELGGMVVELLKEYFEAIVNIEFTAGMEDRLDEIAEGEGSCVGLLHDFYHTFSYALDHAEKEIGQVELPVEVSDIPCEHCGKLMVVKQGRYGKFLACPGFPECRSTKPILKDIGVPCPQCGGAVVERRTKRGKNFYGCANYPACDFLTWDAPLTEACPVCGAFMVKHNLKNGRFLIRCSNEACSTRENTKTTKKTGTRDGAAKPGGEKKTDVKAAAAETKRAAKIASPGQPSKPRRKQSV